MPASVTIKSLKHTIDEEVQLSPALSPDNAFVYWFMQALLTSDANAARGAIVGRAADKGVDAVYIDHPNRMVLVVQGKYHLGQKAPTEVRGNVIGFANLARTLNGTMQDLAILLASAAPGAKQKLSEARGYMHNRNYALKLYYVTTGKASSALESEAEAFAEANDAEFTLFDRNKILRLLRHYLTTDSRPIPFLDLPIEASTGGNQIERQDQNGRIRSWVFAMQGLDLGNLYARTGDRIFAKNIRGFLGKDNEVNRSIRYTLERAPQNFWYFNNGVTFVCEGATEHGHVLRVFNPQIINGQQTTRTLKDSRTKKASVLVRVIAIDSEISGGDDQYERLVSAIVAATNYQNAIFPSDLRSNDAEQVRIEREFRRLGYDYIRKRRSKKEAKSIFQKIWRFTVTKEDLAKAIAGCEFDPLVVRSGKEQLFEDEYYPRVFSGRSGKEYLTYVWIDRWVRWAARRKPERAYARWVVLNFSWKQVCQTIGRGVGREKFLVVNKLPADEWHLDYLYKFVDQVYNAALAFYRKRRGKGPDATDISTFFKRKGLDERFTAYWRSLANTRRGTAMRYLKRFEDDLADYELE